MSLPAFAGAVLTGGASRRMGRDKATLPVLGIPMAERVADSLRGAGACAIASIGGDPGVISGAVHLADDLPGSGPLPAIGAALAWSPAPVIVVLACDLPLIDPDLVVKLVAAVVAHDAPPVAAAQTDRLEPLCAAWRVGDCAAAVAGMVARGLRAVHAALGELGVTVVDADGSLVRNVNTPDDLAAAEGAARALPTVGHGLPTTRLAASSRSVSGMPMHEISVHELADELARGAVLFDVRQPAEFAEARVPGGRLIPLGEVPDHLDEFRANEGALIICRSGGRSGQACDFLASQGIRAVNVAGGTLAWIAAGFDVDSGDAEA